MMGRRIGLPLAFALALVLPVTAQVQTAVEDESCPGTLGINHLLCVGGSCRVNLHNGRGITHDFSTEPRIESLTPGSPATSKLLLGDVITAIDGVLITTREGGRRLANPKPGVPVVLRIRRNGVAMDVSLVPLSDCEATKLAVRTEEPAYTTATAGRWEISLSEARHADFGMELDCGRCGWQLSRNGKLKWFADEAPKVRTVEEDGPADRAGIKPGDVLLTLDRRSFTKKEDGAYLGALRPGQKIAIEYQRGGAMIIAFIVPNEASAQP